MRLLVSFALVVSNGDDAPDALIFCAIVLA